MRLFITLLLSLSAFAQAPITVTPEMHENALKLVDAIGIKTYLQGAFDRVMEEGKATALARSPKFADEWERRMRLRITVDDYLAIAARALEVSFTLDEVKEVITVIENRKAGQQANPSAALGEKLNSVMPNLSMRVEAAAAATGARISKEVSDSVEKDHPEYLQGTTEPAKQPAIPTLR